MESKPEYEERKECPQCGSNRLFDSPATDNENRTKRCLDCNEIMTFDIFIGRIKTSGGIIDHAEKAREQARRKPKKFKQKVCVVCDKVFMTDTDRDTCGEKCLNVAKRRNRNALIFASKGGQKRVQDYQLKQKKKVKKMKGLTARQREVLDFIRDYKRENEFMPTFREIGVHLGITSTKGITDHLSVLKKKGYINRISGQARTITLTDKAKELYANEISE